MRHLTDDEIQAYMDGSAPTLDPDLKTHLETCRLCQDALRQYRMLYEGLADDTVYEIPPDLAQTVVSRLGLEPSSRRAAFPADVVLVAGAIIAAVAVALNFLDFMPLLGPLLALRATLFGYAATPLESARTYLVGLNHVLTIGLAAIAILVFMGALDAAFRRKGPVFVRHARR